MWLVSSNCTQPDIYFLFYHELWKIFFDLLLHVNDLSFVLYCSFFYYLYPTSFYMIYLLLDFNTSLKFVRNQVEIMPIKLPLIILIKISHRFFFIMVSLVFSSFLIIFIIYTRDQFNKFLSFFIFFPHFQ